MGDKIWMRINTNNLSNGENSYINIILIISINQIGPIICKILINEIPFID